MPACSATGVLKSITKPSRTSFYIYLFGYFTDLCLLSPPKAVSLICFFHRVTHPLPRSVPLHSALWLALQSSDYQPGEILPYRAHVVKSEDMQVVTAGDREELCVPWAWGGEIPAMLLTTYKAQDSPPAKTANSA